MKKSKSFSPTGRTFWDFLGNTRNKIFSKLFLFSVLVLIIAITSYSYLSNSQNSFTSDKKVIFNVALTQIDNIFSADSVSITSRYSVEKVLFKDYINVKPQYVTDTISGVYIISKIKQNGVLIDSKKVSIIDVFGYFSDSKSKSFYYLLPVGNYQHEIQVYYKNNNNFVKGKLLSNEVVVQ